MLDVNFDVNQAIKDAEAALGKYGPAIYNAAKHQVAAQATTDLFWMVAALAGAALLLIPLVLCIRGLFQPSQDYLDDHFGLGMATAAIGALFVAALVLAGVAFTDWYQITNAPDWAALQLLKP